LYLLSGTQYATCAGEPVLATPLRCSGGWTPADIMPVPPRTLAAAGDILWYSRFFNPAPCFVPLVALPVCAAPGLAQRAACLLPVYAATH